MMAKEIIRFGEFELDPGAFELRRGGSLVRLERIPLELLILLTEKRGQLVTREQILERIWGKGVFVDADNSINTAVRKIRVALQDNSESPRFVFTVPAKGYRIVEGRRPRHPHPERSQGRVREITVDSCDLLQINVVSALLIGLPATW